MRSETSFDLDGDLMMVDAVVVGPLGRVEVRLVFDTGATLTTLIPSIAQAIGYPPEAAIRRSRMRSAVADQSPSVEVKLFSPLDPKAALVLDGRHVEGALPLAASKSITGSITTASREFGSNTRYVRVAVTGS